MHVSDEVWHGRSVVNGHRLCMQQLPQSWKNAIIVHQLNPIT